MQLWSVFSLWYFYGRILSMVYKWRVMEPERIDVLLRKKVPESLEGRLEVSNSKIRRLIMAGKVSVNGSQCRNPSFVLKNGATVSADIDEERFFFEKKPDDIDFELTDRDVLFEDDSIIVVNKPAFLPSEPTIVKDRGNMHASVIKYLWARNPSLRNPPYVGIMHRLDRETSGVLLFTKTRAVNPQVHDMFEHHTAVKTYRAVCTLKGAKKALKEGDSFTVDNFIGRISAKSAECRMGPLSESRGGQSARTDFTLKEVRDGLYYFDCILHTGRTHQIRVHLSQSGFPLCGDELYGGNGGFKEYGSRIMLHAFSLEFPHPVTGETIKVTAPLPEGFGS